MSISGEPPNLKGISRARVLVDHQKRNSNVMGESLDLSKVSPSNGSNPTAVSSRNQTIPSREVSRPQRMADQSWPRKNPAVVQDYVNYHHLDSADVWASAEQQIDHSDSNR